MVNWRRLSAPLLGLAWCLVGSGDAKDLADYQLGDRVETDIATPFALTVLDAEATAVLKEKEAMSVLVILRYDPGVATDVEANVLDTFNNTRSNFVRAVERYFNQRQLPAHTLASPELEVVRTNFQRLNKGYPVSSNLAVAWASGDSGRVEQSAVVERVREIMRQPIRDQNAQARIKVTTRARLITVADRDEALTPETVGDRGRTIQRTNAIALDRARRDLIAKFPGEEAATGRFVASFLQWNCRLEEELTEQLRARFTEALAVMTDYQPNDMVARTGQIVDAKILAAVKAILEKQAEAKLKEAAALAARQEQQQRERVKWLAIGSALMTLALAVVTWQWWRRRREAALLPVLAGAHGLPAASPEAAVWQQRALEAERRVERAHEALRAGVMKQVNNVLRDELVQGLLTQRKELVEAQQAAASELESLEKRLDEIHAPLQERLQAYENRIAELEKALAAKDEQNRELIKAKIALVRKQLESERAKNQVVLN